MRRPASLAIVPALLIALVTTRPATAQVSWGADLGAYSAYVWRGLTFANRPVIQPDLWLSVPVGGNGSITVGGWSSIEPVKYDNATKHISEGGGVAGPDLAEFDWWAEFGTTVGTATVTLGATGYLFPNDKNAVPNSCCKFTSDNNTTEVYGKLALGTILSPALRAWYDIDKIKGLYVEGAISHGVAVSPSFTLTLGALAGFNAGMGCKANGAGACTVAYNFFDNGFTHADFSVGTSFSAGSLSISPVFHLQISGDEFAKINSPTKIDEGMKIWFGVTLNYAGGGGGDDAAAE